MIKQTENQMLDEILLNWIRYAVRRDIPLIDVKDELILLNLCDMAQQHHVLPMVYESIWATTAYRGLSVGYKSKLRTDALGSMLVQTRQTAMMLNWQSYWQQNNLKALIFKGLICRQLYPEPDLRVSGDEDIYIKTEEFERWDELLQKMGFVVIQNIKYQKWKNCKGQSRRSFVPEEITYVDNKNGINLEVHTRLFPKRTRLMAEMENAFSDLFAQSQAVEIDGIRVYTMSDSQHLLYLFFHYVKHFVYAGVGIRQLCDIMLFAEQKQDTICWEWIVEQVLKLKLERFWNALFAICVHWLGMSVDKVHFVQRTERSASLLKKKQLEPLLQDIMEGGAYGGSDIERNHAANMTLAAVDGKEKAGIWQALFPTADYIRQNYPYTRRNCILLPLGYGHRILAYWSRKRRKGGKTGIAIGKQRTELLKQYGVIPYEDGLNTDRKVKRKHLG